MIGTLAKWLAIFFIVWMVFVGVKSVVFGDGPTEVELKTLRTQHSTTYLSEDSGFRRTVFGRDLNTDRNGNWDSVDLSFQRRCKADQCDRLTKGVRVLTADDEFTSNGSNVAKATVRRNSLDLVNPKTGVGIRWILPSPARVEIEPARVEDREKVSFIDKGLIWEIRNTSNGSKLEATVSAPRGRQTYTFPYELLGGTTLAMDGAGLVGQGFRLTAPVVIDASEKRYKLSYNLTNDAVSFTFDDSVVPLRNYPYVIDPTTTFSVGLSANDGHTQSVFAAYPPACSSVNTSNTGITILKSDAGSGNDEIRTGFMFWDTSSLPDDAVVSQALFGGNRTVNNDDDSRSLNLEWFTQDLPFICAYDKALVGTTAGTFDLTDLATITSPLTGSNPTNVSLDGFTAILLGISGGDPAGNNQVTWDSFDSGTPPTLEVTYTSPLDATVPDISLDQPITAYQNVLESGDMLVLVPYEITIPDGTPSNPATNEYQFIFRDNTSWFQVTYPKSTSDNGNKGYEEGLTAFFFNANQVSELGLTFNSPGTYTVELDSINGLQNTTSTDIVWRSNANKDELLRDLTAIADNLEAQWNLDLIQDGRLTSTGQSYFASVVPNLARMLPEFMSLSVDRASPVIATHSTSASDSRADFWAGTIAADGFQSLGDDFGMTSLQMRTAISLLIAFGIIVVGLVREVPAWFTLTGAGIWLVVAPEIGMAPTAMALVLGFLGMGLGVFAWWWSRST